MRPEPLQLRHCEPCKGGTAPMDRGQAEQLLASVEGWQLSSDARQIRRSFSFRNFIDAQKFAVAVGAVADQQGHHPDIAYGWGYCTITFYTHKIGGLHENDFIMAARVNLL